MMDKKPEVLAPAGDRERLEAALRFGADAVYLGGKLFNMRAGTRSFTQEELAEADAEPRLDLSANKVDAAASALRGSEEATAEEPPAPDANRVVAPGLDDEEPRTNTVVTPSPDYFDTTPNPQPGDAQEEVEIPGAIFSYPILRQQGEPILDEGTPPPPTPHRPLMPSITLADEDDEESGSVVPAPMTRPTAPAAPAPQKTAKAQTKRRRKAIMALRALHRKIGD